MLGAQTGLPENAPAGAPIDLRGAYAGLRTVVTGGAGFIGSRLTRALVDAGASVTIVDDLSADGTDEGAEAAASAAGALVDARPDRVRFVHASVLDPRSLDDAFERAQVVFHLAALSSVPRSIDQPERCIEVNVRGTVEVCQASRIARARRVVLASSASVYGDNDAPAMHERLLPRPLSPYAASKLAAEHILAVWSRCFALSTASARLFNVYGPGQRASGADGAAIASFIARLLDGRAPIIHGAGTQTRDFVHVDDAVHALLLMGASARPLAGEAFNIASGVSVPVLDAAKTVAGAFGRASVAPEHAPARAGDLPRSVADISAARAAFGFEPTLSLRDGVAATVADLRAAAITFPAPQPGADAQRSRSATGA